MKKANLIENKFKTLLFVSIFGWIILLVGQVVDNVLAGHIIGESGLAAVQIIIPFSTFISAIGSFVGVGFSVKFSHLKGRGKEKEAFEVLGLGLICTILVGVITALIMFFLKEQLLSIFTMSEAVKKYVYEYYTWYVGIAIVQPLFLFFFKVISQDGDPLWTVMSSIGQVVVNFVLSSILIKRMGIVGLSLGSFISICVGIVIVCVHFFTKKNSIKIRFKFNPKELKDPAIFGFPALLGNVSIAVVNFFLNLYITNNFGDAYLASFTLICFIINLKLAFCCISDCLGGFFSTARGSGNNEDIKLCFKLLKKYAAIISLILTAIVMSLCTVIPMLFRITSDSSQYVYSYMACLIIAPTFICFSFTINLGASYTAIGKPKITLINQIISNLILPLGLPILFAYLMKNYYGIIVGSAVSAVLSIAIMSIALAIIHKPHRVFEAPKISDEQFSFDMFLKEEEIEQNRAKILEKLAAYNIKAEPTNKIISLYDEGCKIIVKNNPDRVITLRMVFSFSKEKVVIFFKNNGRILSQEEKETELIEHKEEHETLNYVVDNNYLNMSTMISFNAQTVVINLN